METKKDKKHKLQKYKDEFEKIEGSKIITKFIFPHPIEKVWAIMYDMTICHYLFESETGPITILKGNNTYDIGNQFQFFFRIMLVFTVSNIVNEKNYKKISWIIESEGKLPYEIVLTFHEITYDNSTLLHWISIYHPCEIIDEKIIWGSRKIRNYMIKRKNKFLKTVFENFTQIESVNIKCDIEEIWRIITDFNLFKKISKRFCDDAVYDGNPLQVGTKIKLTVTQDKVKVVCYLMVVEVDTKCDDSYLYKLKCIHCIPKAPMQYIEFSIIRIKALKFCHLIFKHEFKQSIFNTNLDFFQHNKEKILKTIKNYIETTNGNNKNFNKIKSENNTPSLGLLNY
jgi:hypothetical protein